MFLVGILEFLSLGGIHLPRIIEIPLILAIILVVGHKTFMARITGSTCSEFLKALKLLC